jgi:hypothetical protein
MHTVHILAYLTTKETGGGGGGRIAREI